MNVDKYLTDLASSLVMYGQEGEMKKNINLSLNLKEIDKIDYGPWPDYKYYIQRLCSKDYSFSHKKISPNPIPLDTVLIRGFEICGDLCSSLFGDGKDNEEKVIECHFIIYKMALISNKMLKAEYGFSNYLEKNIKIHKQEAFIDDVCYTFLKMILTLFFKDKEITLVYSIINTGISRLKTLNINYGYHEESPINVARASWINLLSIIKCEIEGTLLIKPKQATLKTKWVPNSYSSTHNFLKESFEIFLPYPGTSSIKTTLDLVDKYLHTKAIDSDIEWIKTLFKSQPKDSKGDTLSGYYPTLRSFFKSAKKHGIIKSNIRPTEFRSYLLEHFSNSLSTLNGFSGANPKKNQTTEKYLIFDDMAAVFKDFK